jgi:hypothetical protein
MFNVSYRHHVYAGIRPQTVTRHDAEQGRGVMLSGHRISFKTVHDFLGKEE